MINRFANAVTSKRRDAERRRDADAARDAARDARDADAETQLKRDAGIAAGIKYQ